MISFEMPPEMEALRNRTRQFVEDVLRPGEKEIRAGKKTKEQVVKELRPSARDAGFWCTMLPKEAGGMGLTPLENAIVQVELTRVAFGPSVCNSEGPDDATMVTIWEKGTPEQKERFLKPLVNGQARICFSMTEKAAGGDATGMQTKALRDGDTWTINGEKWFSSNADISNFCLLMAKTDPDAPRHKQFSTFLLELPAPGYNIIRRIPMAGRPSPELEPAGHNEVQIKDLVVPHKDILGGQGNGFDMGQLRLGYGRLRHGFHNLANAQLALDLAVGRAINRVTFGEALADRQGILWNLADCARDLYIGRLMVLHIAYLVEKKRDFRQENAIAKVFLAQMVYRCVDTAVQMHGALGLTTDTPLGEMLIGIRSQRVVDGPDEVHRWRAGRNLVNAYKKHGTAASACGGDLGV